MPQEDTRSISEHDHVPMFQRILHHSIVLASAFWSYQTEIMNHALLISCLLPRFQLDRLLQGTEQGLVRAAKVFDEAGIFLA